MDILETHDTGFLDRCISGHFVLFVIFIFWGFATKLSERFMSRKLIYFGKYPLVNCPVRVVGANFPQQSLRVSKGAGPRSQSVVK